MGFYLKKLSTKLSIFVVINLIGALPQTPLPFFSLDEKKGSKEKSSQN
jgi:hypothetical protein